MFKKAKENFRKYLEKFVADGAKNFIENYRTQHMISGTTHTRYIHHGGDKNNDKMERVNMDIKYRMKIMRVVKKTNSSIFKGLQIS